MLLIIMNSILLLPGIYEHQIQSEQHLILQPIEFDHRHRNLYGYLALASAILMLINYLMIKERTCQISLVNGTQNYDLIQSFHMIALIVCIIVFVLSYFNFAIVLYEFKLLFYSTAALIAICACLILYDAIAMTTAPCVSLQDVPASALVQTFDAQSVISETTNVFTAKDTVGILVFIFDLVATVLLLWTGLRFYQKH